MTAVVMSMSGRKVICFKNYMVDAGREHQAEQNDKNYQNMFGLGSRISLIRTKTSVAPASTIENISSF